MVQIIENWSNIEGTIQNVHALQTNPGFVAVDVQLHNSAKVEHFPDLMAQRVGSTVTLQIPEQVASQLAIASGDKLRVRVRQAGPNRFFVDPAQVEKNERTK